MACLMEWRVYLEGAQLPTEVYIDHLNLTYFMTTKALEQAIWSKKLRGYNF